jgi:Tol biopolymer transport system component
MRDARKRRALRLAASFASVVLLCVIALPAFIFKTTAQTADQKPNAHTEALDANNKIAFASDRDGNFEIYVMNPDGGAQTRLTNNPADDLNPTWSPDGTQLAFVSTRSGTRQIWLMNSDGSNQRQLTFDGTDNLNPVWSPDGTKILFVSSVNGNDEIYVANVGAGIAVFPPPVTNLTNNQYDDINPTWRPDGQKIAFASNRDGKYQIYTMNPDGTGVTRITNSTGNDTNPFWSPGRITFQSDRDGTEQQLYVMNGDGSNVSRLTNDTASDSEPARSSDGSFIVFTSTLLDNTVLQLYRANADGSAIIRLTKTPASDIQAAVQPRPLSQATGTIQFLIDTYSVNEGAGKVDITVTRFGNTSGVASVDYTAMPGTASARTDFLPVSGTLVFNDGETSKTFTVSIIDNAFIQPDRTVNLSLSSPNNATLGSPANAVLTIIDNDTTSNAPNPIDNAQFFVRQQYLDFLGREPDTAGLQFWTNQITACGTDATCIANKRVDVSAAFFLSNEFQQTGLYVYEAYRVAFGRAPTFAEFLNDVQAVGAGVVFGQTGASDRLGVNKRDYTAAFAGRDAFRALYAGKTNAQFVDALLANADGVFDPSVQSVRDQLVQALNNGTLTRAEVLRTIIEAFTNAPTRNLSAFNRAFVTFEYFGYLRRDPDPDGFNFWLNQLNKFNGDFRAAGMVRAFITSAEYRSRFGSP